MDKELLIARWMADEITDTEFKKQVSPEDFIAYKKLKLATDLYADSKRDLAPDLWNKIEQRIQAKPRKSYLLYRSIAAVAAILLLFIAVNKFLSPSTFTVETGIAKTKRIELPDNSVVVLSPNSLLKYNKDWKGEHNREVYLEGTAYFEVQKGRNFEVKTPNGSVKVLGTKFNVVSLDDWFKVECFEGKVRVTHSLKSIELKPHTSFNMIDNEVKLDEVKENKPLWLSGESRFKSVPLKYVLREMQNHFDVKFVNQGVDENMLFSGGFVHKDLDLSLKLVLKALQINYQKTDKNTIVMKP